MSQVHNGDGTVTETWRSVANISSTTELFIPVESDSKLAKRLAYPLLSKLFEVGITVYRAGEQPSFLAKPCALTLGILSGSRRNSFSAFLSAQISIEMGLDLANTNGFCTGVG